MESKVSIILTVYNKEKYIANTIISIINQTYKNFEVVMVNDGSTDNSIETAEKILKNNKVDYCIINKNNGGQSSARNVGIKNAKGDWLVFPDADDILQNDYLELMLKNVLEYDANVGFSDLQYVTNENLFKQSNRRNEFEVKKGKDFFVDFIMHNVEIGPTLLIINKNFLLSSNIFFNENSNYSEEFIFITDLLYNSNNVVHIKEVLYNYCLREGSVSTGASIEKIMNGFYEIEKYSEKYKKMNDKYSVIYNKFALPRWILATARFTTKYLKYDQYTILMEKLKSKKEIKKLLFFPNIKVKFATIMFLFSKRIFYNICKK